MPDLWGGFPDYYGVLRVAPDASEGELRAAWRTAAKQWHPDTNRSRDSAAMMRRVNEAWHVLGDRDARAVYDEVYFAWRSGSEQLAAELGGRLDAQRERRQARAASQEWTRWGREDRGRWEGYGGGGREQGPGRSGQAGAGARSGESAGAGDYRSGPSGDTQTTGRGSRNPSSASDRIAEQSDVHTEDDTHWETVFLRVVIIGTVIAIAAIVFVAGSS